MNDRRDGTEEKELRQPAISVIVAVGDHSPLDSMLDALSRQDAPTNAFEVIFVDAIHAVDELAVRHRVRGACSAGLRVRYERIERGGRAVAHNCGIRLARARLVLLLGDDFIPVPGLVAQHIALHEREPQRHIVGIGPGVFAPEDRTSSFMRWLDDSGELLGVSFTADDSSVPDHYFYAANTSAKKALLIAAGLFDEDFPHDAWDDYELGLRLSGLGMKSVYLPGALAHHKHHLPVRERRRAMNRAGISAAIFERKYPGPHAWQRACRHPPWLLELAAQWYLLKSVVRRDPRALGRYYHLTLQRTFVAAYRRSAVELYCRH